MTKTLLALAATVILSTTVGHAAGIVPGSDTTVRQEQTRQDFAIATGATRNRTAATVDYGYAAPAGRGTAASPATNRADDRAVDRGAGVRTLSRSALVPGSDSF